MTHPTDALRLVPLDARDLDALRYVLNRADETSRIRTVMSTFTLPERETTAERLERLYANLKSAAPASSLPEGGRTTCQVCGGTIEAWVCQGCNAHFHENDAGSLILGALPAAATGDA